MKVYDVSDLRARLAGAFPFAIVPAHTSDEHWYQREDTGKLAASVTTQLSFVAKTYLFTWYVKRAIEHITLNRDRLSVEFDTVLTEASGAAVKSRDRSADIGTTAHDAIDRFISRWISSGRRGDSVVADLEALCRERGVSPRIEEVAACRSFDLFRSENEIIPLATELRVWYEHGKDCFAGTIDSVLLVLSVRKGRDGSGMQCVSGSEHEYVAQGSGTFWCAMCSRECDVRLVLGDWKSSNVIKGKEEYAHQTTAYAHAIEKACGFTFDDIWIVRFEKKRAEYEVLKVADRKQAWKEFLAISRAFSAKHERGKTSLLAPLVEREITRI